MKNKCKSSIYTKILTQPFPRNQQAKLSKKQVPYSNVIKSRTSSRVVSNKKLVQTPKNDYELHINKQARMNYIHHDSKNSATNLDKLAKYSSEILLSRVNKCNTNFMFGSQQVSAQKQQRDIKDQNLIKNCQEYENFSKEFIDQNGQLKVSHNSKQKSQSGKQLSQFYFKNSKGPLLSHSQKIHPKDTFRKIGQTLKTKSKNKNKNNLKPNFNPSKTKHKKQLSTNKNSRKNAPSRGTSNQKNRSATQTSPTIHCNSPLQQLKSVQRQTETRNNSRKIIKLQKCRRATTVSSHSRLTDYIKPTIQKQRKRQHQLNLNLKTPQCGEQQLNLSLIFNQTCKVLNNYQMNLNSCQKQRDRLANQNKQLKAIISEYCHQNKQIQKISHKKYYKKFSQITAERQQQPFQSKQQKIKQKKFLDQQSSQEYIQQYQ